MRKLKEKICRICQNTYEPYSTTSQCCSIKCVLKQVEAKKDKQLARQVKQQETSRKRETALRKLALKTKSQWLKEAQQACNAYIRRRDQGLPCISCGTTNPNIQYCAGHFKTRGGHPALRFHPMNIHRQCNHTCNLQKSGSIDTYRPALIEKIGIDNVNWLEGPHQEQKLTIDDIKDIKQYYKQQLKQFDTLTQ